LVVDLEDYSLARVIKGLYGTAYKTIAVDADGNIIGVFKGDYAGTLTTLAVDSQGRIQAVLADPEDVFGNPNYMGAAELAARLGSINTFERRGTTVWMDDFEDGANKWKEYGSGDGYSTTITIAQAFTGSCSMLLTCGSSDNYQAQILRRFAVPVFGKIGYEFHFWMDGNVTSLFFRPTISYEGDYYVGGFNMDKTNSKIQYLGAGILFHDLPGDYTFYDAIPQWYSFKFVIDYNTKKYVRAIFGNETLDVSDLDIYSDDTGGVDQISAVIQAIGKNGVNAKCYIDDVIITQNEP